MVTERSRLPSSSILCFIYTILDMEGSNIVYADGLGDVTVTDPIRMKILKSATSYSNGLVSVWVENIVGCEVQRFVPLSLYQVFKQLQKIQQS